MAANPMNIMDVANYVQQQGALGQQQGQTQRFNALAGQAYNAPAGADRSALVGQAVATDPRMGVQLGNVLATKDAAAQTADTNHLQKIANAAKLMVQVYNGGKGDPAAIQGTWNNIAPYLGQVSGKAPPPQFDPSMLPAMYQAIAASNQGPEKGIVLGGGSQLRSPTGELLADNPTVPNMQFQNVATGKLDGSGNPIMQQGGYNPRTGAFMPVQGPAPAAGNPQPQAMQPGATTAQLPAGAGSTYAPSLPAVLSDAVLRQESGGNPAAVSSAGATGLMQLMPQTAANPGFGIMPAQDGSQQENQRVGQQYLAALSQKYGGNMQLALAAYNAGPGRVDAAMQQAGGDPTKAIASLPDETQNYIPSVLAMAGGQPSAQAAPSAQLGFGQSAKSTPATTDVIGTREKQFQQLVDKGAIDAKAPDFEQQRSSYLMNGKVDSSFQGGGSIKPLGDLTKTGAEYLATVPGSERDTMHALLNGTVSMPTGSALKSPLWQSMLAGTVHADPSWNQGQYKQYADTRKYFTTGKGGVTINNISTAMGHADEVLDAVNALDNGKLRPAAAAANYLSENTGGTAVTNFNGIVTALASEMASVYKNGNSPTDQETDHWRNQISVNMSKGQQTDVLRHWVDLLTGKMNAVQSQYRSGMSKMSDPLTVVSPDARDAMARINAFADKVSGNTGSHPQLNDSPVYAPGQQQPTSQNPQATGAQDFSHLWGGGQ